MRLRSLLTIALTSLAAVPAHAQQTNPATASPYIQQRSNSNTSFDNPYAPGGIYDPYRSSRTLPGGQKPGQTSGSGLKSGADGLSDDGILSGGNGQCGGKKFGGGIASGPGKKRRGTAGSYSGLSGCGGLAGYGNSRFGSTSGMGHSYSSGSMGKGGLSGRLGTHASGQAAGMQQQHMQSLQQLPR